MPKPSQEGPNPLFTRWLQEWRDEAAERGRLRSQRAYERALSSLCKYPLPLRSGREARILLYFGEKICRQLDEQLERYRSTQDGTALAGLPAPASWKGQKDGDNPAFSDSSALQPAQSSLEPVQRQQQCSKKKQIVAQHRARSHVPTRRSPAYAVLLALYHNSMNPDSRDYLTKSELQKTAQPLCDKSFFLADPGSKSTAWSTVSTLIRKELVLKTNIPARYSLTEAGLTLARELLTSEEPKGNNASAPKATASQSREPPLILEENDRSVWRSENSDRSTTSKSSCEDLKLGLSKPQFVFEPGQFDVILCVDFIETTGAVMVNLDKLKMGGLQLPEFPSQHGHC